MVTFLATVQHRNHTVMPTDYNYKPVIFNDTA